MNDRELLEAVARAVGLRWSIADLVWYDDSDGSFVKQWNPLTDDGDALRLAVKLRIDIGWVADQVAANNCCEAQVDPYAAARRAIVRAAAEIGGKP